MISEPTRAICAVHASAVQAVSVKISDSVASQFSMMISEPTGAVCTLESMRQPWKHFVDDL